MSSKGSVSVEYPASWDKNSESELNLFQLKCAQASPDLELQALTATDRLKSHEGSQKKKSAFSEYILSARML
jgi:hypothetical protein